MGKLTFNREVKLGDLLTITTILISLVSVIVSWTLDRRLERGKEATAIRQAAASGLGDLERWRSLSLSLTDQAQPAIIEASEAAALGTGKKGFRTTNAEQARDLLWRRLTDLDNTTSQRIRDEKLENGYIPLLAYAPDARAIYTNTGAAIERQRLRMLERMLLTTQDALLDYMDRTPRSAQVGDALRRRAQDVRVEYQRRYEELLKPARTYLIAKIEAGDDALLAPPGKPVRR